MDNSEKKVEEEKVPQRTNPDEPKASTSKKSNDEVKTVREVVKGHEFWSCIECPVCYQIPFGEITVCEIGHHLCRTCKSQIKKDRCPVCRGYMGKTRSLAMEGLIGGSTFTCPMQCDISLRIKGKDMMAHLKDECELREISCNFCADKKMVKVKEFIKHLEDEHKRISMDDIRTLPRPEGCPTSPGDSVLPSMTFYRP